MVHIMILELHQLDTILQCLNSNDQDFLNSAAGVRAISTPGISSDVAELKDMVKALLLDKKNQSPAPTPVKAVEESCVTCGGAHSYQTCPPPLGNVVQPPAYQAPAYQALAPQIQGVSNEDFQAYVKANELVMRNMPPSKNDTNPKEDLKGITTRSGVAYKRPTIPTTSSPKVVERETKVTKDTMPPTNNGITRRRQTDLPLSAVRPSESIFELVNAPVVAWIP
ncbi:hypothetical protein Tco_0173094 [Tanacetum coccineum]